jgi:hypothetical protein
MNACTTFGLAGSETVAALDSLGLRGGVEQWQIVAGLAVSGREDLAGRALLQHPAQRGISQSVEIGGDAHPVQVHVCGQGGGRRTIRQTALLVADFGQGHPQPTDLAGDRQLEVAGLLQFLEVL